MSKKIGTISYNIYCNFTNYGSALQTWALHQAIKKVTGDMIKSVLVDYCPEILVDKDPLNPFANMWDKDEESLKYQSPMRKHIDSNPDREQFMQDLKGSMTYEEINQKWADKSSVRLLWQKYI